MGNGSHGRCVRGAARPGGAAILSDAARKGGWGRKGRAIGSLEHDAGFERTAELTALCTVRYRQTVIAGPCNFLPEAD